MKILAKEKNELELRIKNYRKQVENSSNLISNLQISRVELDEDIFRTQDKFEGYLESYFQRKDEAHHDIKILKEKH